MPVIMGTAGHIDHGKTTLVKALTGIDCDRLVEEKKRGITIELGFAFLDLPGGGRLGVIDVPGHERFVKNMVAGAHGVDFVLLVIAADEGVMPQTREHLEICALLGVRHGLVALTKADMVEPDWLDMVAEDVRGFLEGTFLEGAPVLPVSAHTGAGLDGLSAELARLAGELAPRRRSDLVRLPVDRVFTMRGHGTVVTGTLVSGSFKVGDDVLLYPGGLASKVRGLQSHGATAEEAGAGRRTAVNLAGLEVEQIQRGDVLARPGTLFPSLVWDLELTLLPSARKELKHRKEVHFHHGTREVLARLHFLDREALAPGETCICQVRFAEPLVGVWGDRVVVRSFSPLRTIAGGRVVNPLGRKTRRFQPEALALLARLAGTDPAEPASPEDVVLAQLALAGSEGLSFARLMTMTDLESKALDRLVSGLLSKGRAFLFDREERALAGGEVVESLAAGALAHLADFHAGQPMKQGVSRGELASTWGRGLPDKLFHLVLERLLKAGSVAAEAELLRLAGHKVSLASDQSRLREAILAAFVAGGSAPPNLPDVLDPLGVSFKEAAPVFKLLQEQGELVKVKEDMYFSTPILAGLRDRVVAYLTDHADMGAPEFKEVGGLTRKYAIPFLEYLDKEKVTVRVGDRRVLRKR
jgi:selenocysteine-specific elongation factor